MNQIFSSRRNFLRGIASGLAVLPFAHSLNAYAAAGMPHLAASDPSAAALGYVENAAKLDPAKEAAFKKGSHCAGCSLYQAAQAGGGYAPCAAFPGKSVNANGWCRAYAAKV
jgi:hypothetical protein